MVWHLSIPICELIPGSHSLLIRLGVSVCVCLCCGVVSVCLGHCALNSHKTQNGTQTVFGLSKWHFIVVVELLCFLVVKHSKTFEKRQ